MYTVVQETSSEVVGILMAVRTHWFSTSDTQKLLANKNVVVIGDSVQRSVYKDLVCLLKANQLLELEDLKKKGEESFEGDKLVEGGSKAGLKSVNYKEVRKFTLGNTVIFYYFVTRCYGEYMKSIIATFETEPPDVLIMNSCLWDIMRYGKNANAEFRTNINELLEEIGLVMPYDSRRMFIWTATLPVVDSNITSYIPFDFLPTCRPENKNVRDANLYVLKQMADYGDHFIFLDLYDIFYSHLEHRINDGVHWNAFAHRKITCLLLTEMSKQWDFKLPAMTNGAFAGPPDPRRTIKPSLTSTPSIGGRRSLGFVPNHSSTPYRRPAPSYIHQMDHSPPRPTNPLVRPFLLRSRPKIPIRVASPGSPRQSTPGPIPISPWRIPKLRFPNRLTSPFSIPYSPRPRPFSFELNRPCYRGTSPVNVNRLPFSSPSANWLLNSTFPPTVRKRSWEDDYPAPIGAYKRLRKFL